MRAGNQVPNAVRRKKFWGVDTAARTNAGALLAISEIPIWLNLRWERIGQQRLIFGLFCGSSGVATRARSGMLGRNLSPEPIDSRVRGTVPNPPPILIRHLSPSVIWCGRHPDNSFGEASVSVWLKPSVSVERGVSVSDASSDSRVATPPLAFGVTRAGSAPWCFSSV
jgi:hypothetical protein